MTSIDQGKPRVRPVPAVPVVTIIDQVKRQPAPVSIIDQVKRQPSPVPVVPMIDRGNHPAAVPVVPAVPIVAGPLVTSIDQGKRQPCRRVDRSPWCPWCRSLPAW